MPIIQSSVCRTVPVWPALRVRISARAVFVLSLLCLPAAHLAQASPALPALLPGVASPASSPANPALNPGGNRGGNPLPNSPVNAIAPPGSNLAAPGAAHVANGPLAPARPAPLNDDGAALTPPDLAPYQAQLDAMQKLERDNIELKLQLEHDQLKAKVDASRGIKEDAPLSDASPYVISVTGVGDRCEALLGVPGYGQTIVRAGDTLPNHWKILAIDDAGVVATKRAGPHAQRLRLPFQADGGGRA